MNAIQLCDLLLTQSLSTHVERTKRWTDTSYRIAHVLPEHPILVGDVQQIGRLDCIVAALETDIANLPLDAQLPQLTLAPDFCVVLAKSWLSLTYEVLRVVKQRLLSRSELKAHWNDGMQSVFSNLERVRMVELKREIAKGSKFRGRVEMVVPGDEQNTAKVYVHGQTVLNSPLAQRSTDGSIVWHAFNPVLGQSEELYRRDLSDRLLGELGKL